MFCQSIAWIFTFFFPFSLYICVFSLPHSSLSLSFSLYLFAISLCVSLSLSIYLSISLDYSLLILFLRIPKYPRKSAQPYCIQPLKDSQSFVWSFGQRRHSTPAKSGICEKVPCPNFLVFLFSVKNITDPVQIITLYFKKKK